MFPQPNSGGTTDYAFVPFYGRTRLFFVLGSTLESRNDANLLSSTLKETCSVLSNELKRYLNLIELE